MSPNAMETEIKLLADTASLRRLKTHPAFAHAKSRLRHEHTTYFDTDDLALNNSGFSLRVRTSGRRAVQTLKRTQAGARVVGQREEWEWPLTSNKLDLQPLAEFAGRTSAMDEEFARARPKFVTDIDRRSYVLELGGGSRIEAVIDRGTVAADSRQEDVSELELEIKDGPLAPLYRLALELSQQIGLRVGTESKAMRGYRLLLGTGPHAEKSESVQIPTSASLQDALSITSSAALNQFIANLPAAREGDVEGVHQTRVALRRLRTVFVVFGPYLEPNAKERFSVAIRKMGTTLGAARDWDVFVLEILRDLTCDGVSEDLLADLRTRAASCRETTHGAVKRLVDSVRPTRLVLGLEDWIASGDWCADPNADAGMPVRDVLPDLLDRLLRKVNKRGRHLPLLSSGELHPLRKSIKKLRYAAESSEELYDSKDVQAYAKHCKKLQTMLGDINDAAMTVHLVEEVEPSPQVRSAVVEWRDARRAQSHDKLVAAWHKLKDAKPFWR
jgi:inorganic triphosphatase YgiF